MISPEFETQYQRLNRAQKEAVDAIEGPVMVAAGPGTGKTQILALRIANILLKTDTRPENILCLTFTDSGVFSMRQRLRAIIGHDAYRIVINTFHGFCNDVIRNLPEEFPNIIGSVNITEADQIGVLEEVFTDLKLTILTTFGDPFYYLRSAQSAIGKLKQEGISPEVFKKKLAEYEKDFLEQDDLYSERKGYEGKLKAKYAPVLKQIEKNKELALVYGTYQQKLRAHKYYDFADMIMETVHALETDADLLLSLQETYQYILVDEHQDTNNAQNRVLELLASFYDNPNLFVVGDEKQAIFRFQGASLENFLYFKQKYPAAKFIILENNYRSSQTILDSAHSLMAGQLGISEKKLQAQAGQPEEKISVYEFSTPEAEEYYIAKSIVTKIGAGEKPEDIAVIYRENRDAFSLATMLGRLGVPYNIESNQDLLEDRAVRKLLRILNAVNNFGQSDLFIESLHLDWLEIEPFDIFKFTVAVGKNKVNAYEAARHEHFLREAGIEQIGKIRQWYEKIARWHTLAQGEDATVVFETIFRDSGLLASILKGDNSAAVIGKINSLFDEVQALIAKKRSATLKDFMAYLEMLDKHEIRLKKNADGGQAGRVRLMTAHGSKGLEFDHVYIPYLRDKHWGNKTHRELIPLPAKIFSLTGEVLPETNENSDERRLFYVALTRAKKTITLTYSHQDKNLKEIQPSMFLAELDKDLYEMSPTAELEEELKNNPRLRYEPNQSKGVSIKDQDFIRELFTTRGFAVTHLNNYLTCPWKYFYMNLLRLPKVPERHLMFGTAMHAALCDFFKQFKEQGEPFKEFLLAAFDRSLALQPIPEEEYGKFLKRGEEALAGYYAMYHGTWRTNVLTEFDIRGILLTPDPSSQNEDRAGIVLTGKIDKLEFLGSGNEVNVVDYKTGKAKSRNKIEGLSASDGQDDESAGGIKRQLAFYRLLLDRYDGGKYKMVSGEIDFLEPNPSGKYKKESFLVTEEDIVELEETIKRVADEIVNLKFWDQRCDDKKCEFCALREMIK